MGTRVVRASSDGAVRVRAAFFVAVSMACVPLRLLGFLIALVVIPPVFQFLEGLEEAREFYRRAHDEVVQ